MNGFATPGEAAENAALWIKISVTLDALTPEQVEEYLGKPDCPDFLREMLSLLCA